MTTPTDLERARAWLLEKAVGLSLKKNVDPLAHLLATVRREAVEECAKIVSSEKIAPCPTDETFAFVYMHVAQIERAIRSKLGWREAP